MQTITLPDLLAQLERGAPLVLVEALPTPHYADAHLPGAVNLPPDQVDQLAPTPLPDQAATIVVYCSNRACLTSHRVAQRLTQLGYTTVLRYPGGKQEWLEAGLPLEQGGTDADQDSAEASVIILRPNLSIVYRSQKEVSQCSSSSVIVRPG